MDYAKSASEVLTLLGGKDNVSSNATCMTRLRVGVKDTSLVDINAIKKVDGVLGLVEADTMQIVFGPGKVNKVGAEFSKLTGISIGGSDDNQNNIEDLAKQNKAENKAKHDGPVQFFLRKIASIFIPLLPGIIAAGLINGITNVINVKTGNAFNEVWWYQLVRTLGWAVFAYLPIFAGMNAAKEFKGTPVLGGVAGALVIANAAMPLLAKFGENKDIMSNMPITNAPYNPAAGGLIAAIIAAIFFAFLERQIRKVMPEILDTFFTPLLTLLIGGFLMLFIFQPAGTFLSNGIYNGLNYVYNTFGVFGGYVLSAGFLPLVSVGLHQALAPIHAMMNDPEGATKGVNFLLPILMMAGGGQVGAAIALYIKTKNKKLKSLIKEGVPVGILGIGEPLMYAVTLPLGKSFITACLGSGIGGILAVIFHLGAISQGVSGLFGLLIMQPGQQFGYIISMLAAYVGGFILTYFFGVDEKRINEVYN